MSRHLIDAGGGRPLLDMPNAAYRAACRVRFYAAWASPELFRPNAASDVFGIERHALASAAGLRASVPGSHLMRSGTSRSRGSFADDSGRILEGITSNARSRRIRREGTTLPGLDVLDGLGLCRTVMTGRTRLSLQTSRRRARDEDHSA